MPATYLCPVRNPVLPLCCTGASAPRRRGDFSLVRHVRCGLERLALYTSAPHDTPRQLAWPMSGAESQRRKDALADMNTAWKQRMEGQAPFYSMQSLNLVRTFWPVPAGSC